MLTGLPAAVEVNKNLKFYPLVPPEAGQKWKLELFVLSETIQPHYHKIQKQFLLVMEGNLTVFYGTKKAVLQPSEFVQIDPGVVHSLVPEGTAIFFAIDLPGFNFPEDVFEDTPSKILPKWTPPVSKPLPLLDSKCFENKIDAGSYSAYDLVNGAQTGKKWSVSLLDIHDSPRHFQRIEKELFFVMNGDLDIERDGVHQVLPTGEFAIINPGTVHQLKSAGKESVRVLCFSFPAFDPADMHSVD